MKSHAHTADRLITAKDHASIQFQIADVDADGKMIKGQSTTIAICGRIRAQGDSDDSVNRIATQAGRKLNIPFGKLRYLGDLACRRLQGLLVMGRRGSGDSMTDMQSSRTSGRTPAKRFTARCRDVAFTVSA
jgi:small subunit ribosomal protein S21e